MVDGRTFLAVAEALPTGPTDEATARTASGGACYAAFHGGRALVKSAGFALPRGPAGHCHLGKHLARSDRASAENLERLRKLRNRADDDVAPMTTAPIGAETALEIARDPIAAMDEIAGSGA